MADAAKVKMAEGDAPATPAAGTVVFYAKTDHLFYRKGSDGVESGMSHDPYALTATLSGDGDYSGLTEAGTAGAALAFGEVCYLAVADSKWELAQANAAATSKGKVGICVLAAIENAATIMLLWGKINAASKFPSFTIGAPVFISAATAGLLTSTAPTGTTDFVVRCMGQANSADELFFNPSPEYIELA